MRNLIKKSLAFVLVAALALTCFVGTFSVSAADTYNANISVTANPVTLGDTEATAVIDIDMVEENVGINEALINISSEIGAIKDVKLTASDVAGEIDYGTGEDVVPADCKGFYLSANSEKVDGESVMGSIASATITVTFAVADTVKAGTYAITIDIPTSKVIAATKDEVAVNFIYDNSVSFVVEEAVTECEHTAAEGNKIVKFEDGVINYYDTCSKCGELVLASTDSSETAAALATTVSGFATYSAIELTDVGSATIALADVDSANIKLAYVDGDKIIANGAHTKTVPFNPISFTYADGVVTVESTVTGIIIAYTLADSTAIDNSLTTAGMGRTIELLSNVSYKFRLTQARLMYNGELVFDSLYALVLHEDYSSGSMKIEETIVSPNEELENGFYVFPYAVAAKQMGDTIICKYYGVKDGVSYLLRVMNDYNVVSYAASVFTTSGHTDTDLCADLLKYGAEAQKVFNYNTDALMTEHKSVIDYIAGNGSNVTVDQLTKLTKAVTTKVNINGAQTNIVGWARTLSLEDKIEINFKLNPTNFMTYYNTTDLSGLSLKMTYYDKDNVYQEVDLTMDDKNSTEGAFYVFVCDQIASSRMSTEATMQVSYNGTVLSTFYYSVESFLVENYNDAELGALCKAIANYSASAVARFNS